MSITKHARTARTIAAELREPLSRVKYVLMTRQHIKPLGIAGSTRIYGERATAQVRHELKAIDARRESGGARDA